MDELFKKSKDLKAAEEVFLGIFSQEDEKVRRELIYVFVKAFKNEYDSYKIGVQDSQTLDKRLSELVEKTKEFDSMSLAVRAIDEAGLMGETLGAFLGIMEYGIPSVEEVTQEFSQRTQTLAYELASTLRRLNKKIKLKFIRNRVTVIAKRHAGKLSKNQQELFARIAAIFT